MDKMDTIMMIMDDDTAVLMTMSGLLALVVLSVWIGKSQRIHMLSFCTYVVIVVVIIIYCFFIQDDKHTVGFLPES